MSKIDMMAIKVKVAKAGFGLFGSDELYMFEQLENLFIEGMAMGYDLLAPRCEAAEKIVVQLTADHNSTPNYVKGFDMAQDHFHDFPNSAIRKPSAPAKDLTKGSPIFPIAKVVVSDNKITKAEMCAPGLPDGEHLLYPVLVGADGVPL